MVSAKGVFFLVLSARLVGVVLYCTMAATVVGTLTILSLAVTRLQKIVPKFLQNSPRTKHEKQQHNSVVAGFVSSRNAPPPFCQSSVA